MYVLLRGNQSTALYFPVPFDALARSVPYPESQVTEAEGRRQLKRAPELHGHKRLVVVLFSVQAVVEHVVYL